MITSTGENKYHGVLNIPEGKCGEYEVRHIHQEPGCVLASNMRTILFGQPARRIFYDHPTKWHQLSYSGGTWMTDLPIEQIQHDALLSGTQFQKGKILVGGLGLGYAATVLANRWNVERVVVVEKSKEVIELVADAIKNELSQYAEGKLEVVQADLFDFLKESNEKFNSAFYDIWQSDGEATFHKVVLPLRELSEGVVKREPVCWNEDVMRGQLALSLRHRVMISSGKFPGLKPYTKEQLSQPVDDVFWDWACPFFEVLTKRKVDHDVVQLLADKYSRTYGMRRWREKWNHYVEVVLS